MEEKKYDFSAIESKWQKYWDEHQTFKAENGSTKPKFYALVEFPYPSGAGMHVGHIKAYSGLEVVSRKRRLQGYNVLFPIGFEDRKSTRLNSSHSGESRMPSSA